MDIVEMTRQRESMLKDHPGIDGAAAVHWVDLAGRLGPARKNTFGASLASMVLGRRAAHLGGSTSVPTTPNTPATAAASGSTPTTVNASITTPTVSNDAPMSNSSVSAVVSADISGTTTATTSVATVSTVVTTESAINPSTPVMDQRSNADAAWAEAAQQVPQTQRDTLTAGSNAATATNTAAGGVPLPLRMRFKEITQRCRSLIVKIQSEFGESFIWGGTPYLHDTPLDK
jgi:hypothetical protein